MSSREERSANNGFFSFLFFLCYLTLFLFWGLLAVLFRGDNASSFIPALFIISIVMLAILATFAYLKTGFTFRPICKKLLEKKECGVLLICDRCRGFYLGLFLSIPISAYKLIVLPTNYAIIFYGIIVGLNALHGVLRRLGYSIAFFTSDRAAFVLGFLFGIATTVHTSVL